MYACVAREHPLNSVCYNLHTLGHNEHVVGRAYKETLTTAAFLLLLE